MPQYEPSRLYLNLTTGAPNWSDEVVSDRFAWLEKAHAQHGFPDTWQERYRSAAAFVAQNLVSFPADLSKWTALEVGCGNGAKSFALAPLFKAYVGIDLLFGNAKYATQIAAKQGVGNVHFHPVTVEAIENFLRTCGHKFNVIFLIAVLEHLTIDERLAVLKAAWEHLPENGFLYIGETPNRLAVADHHTYFLPYIHSLPDKLALKYLDRSPRKDVVERVHKAADPVNEMWRNGRGVSFHEFELAIAPIDKLRWRMQTDGFDLVPLNTHPVRNYEALRLEEFRIVRPDNRTVWPKLPPFFARQLLEGIITKSAKRRPLAGSPQFLKSGVHNKSVVDLLGQRDATGYQYGFPQFSLNGSGIELILPLPATSQGQFTFALARSSSGRLRIRTNPGGLDITFDVRDILDKQPLFWIPYCILAVDIERPVDEIRLSCESSDGAALVHAPCFRPFVGDA